MIKHIVFTKFENPDEQAPKASEMLLARKETIPEKKSASSSPRSLAREAPPRRNPIRMSSLFTRVHQLEQ